METSTNSIPSAAAVRCRRKINEIIVHCTATRAGRDYSVRDVRRWHLQRGFSDIGYHYLVRLDGTVEPGRPLDRPGAHCLAHNRCSIGVCYVGGLDQAGAPCDTRTAAQRYALIGLLSALKTLYPQATIHGHRDFAAKVCPCFDATAEYASL